MNLAAVAAADIPLDQPLPWALFDQAGNVVYPAGAVLMLPGQAEGLYRGIPRPAVWEGFPPDGIKPQIGGRLHLYLTGRSTQSYFQCRLIGYVRAVSLLVTHPQAAGQRVVIAEGEKVEVRLLSGREICVFPSTVVRVCISPLHYLHLGFPEQARRQALRESPWAAVNFTVVAANELGQTEIGRIVNLSCGGARLELAGSLGRLGERISLSLKADLDDLHTTLALPGVIRHVDSLTGDDQDRHAYGVEFDGLDAEARLWLKCLVYQHIAEGHPL